jgi:hypothetical protein
MIFSKFGSENVRRWWEDRCIEWCYARHEDGKFGDQKYLDDWPLRFESDVHVMTDKELLLAPWNATRYPYGNSVAWHFQSLRIVKNSTNSFYVDIGTCLIPRCTRDNVYRPYLQDLSCAIKRMRASKIQVLSQSNNSRLDKVIAHLRTLISRLWVFNMAQRLPLTIR